MKLQSYLDANGIGYAAFARAIGSPHRRNIERYAKGIRRPGLKLLRAISTATDGAVTPNDFFDVTTTDTAVGHE